MVPSRVTSVIQGHCIDPHNGISDMGPSIRNTAMAFHPPISECPLSKESYIYSLIVLNLVPSFCSSPWGERTFIQESF